MGSGSNRKDNDQPLIKRPKKNTPTIDNENAGGLPVDSILVDICQFKFQVPITKSALTIVGSRLELIPEGSLYAYSILGQRIGSLSKKWSDMITSCNNIGVRYTGIIVEEQGELYARFTRLV